MTDHYAVFGFPIKHSKSPRIHTLFAEQTGQDLQYRAEAVPAENFAQIASAFFQHGGKGLNCTVPLKELAWQFAAVKTERAERAKAVNTLALQADGSILGDNTDGCGLVRDLMQNHAVFLNDLRILVLGAGGASRGILAPILKASPQCLVIANRTVEKAQQLAAEFTDMGKVSGCGFADLSHEPAFDLILNATSASLTDELPPLPDDLLVPQGVCYDLAYSNKPTAFVRWGLEHDAAKSVDGLGMLVEQAAEAFLIWRGVLPNTAPVLKLLNAERG